MLKFGMLASAFVLLTAQAVAAQSYATDKGSIRIGGSGGFTSSKSDGTDDRVTTIELRPALQYFVVPGLGIGGEVSLVRASTENASNTLVGIGPIVSYYWGRPTRTQPYLSGQVGFSRTSFGNNDFTQTSLRGAAGLLMLLSSSVGINAELFYSDVHADLPAPLNDTNGNSFGVALGVSAFVF